MPVELRIPEVGESVTEAHIAHWLKAEGDHVERDEPVVELETDKATLELPAPAAGTLTGPLKPEGHDAAIGDVIGYIQEAGDGAKKTAPQEKAPAPEAKKAAPAQAPAASKESAAPEADAESTEETSEAPEEEEPQTTEKPAARQAPKPAPPAAHERPAPAPPRPVERPSAAPPAALSGDGERQEEIVPMTPLRRRIAQRLVQAQQQAALLTTFNEVDMSAVMGLRRQLQEAFQARYGIKLGLMSFFVKATIDALRQFPGLNAEIRDTNIVYRNYYDIGIAVSTSRGLVVPVLRDAHRMSFAEIERAIADFATRAGDNRLKLEELRGGTFTITNGGVFGSLLSTPIVNPPQSGVLGMHAIQDRAVVRGGAVVVRAMMYLALTYDHRMVDGQEAVTFLKRIIATIEEPARMLIEV